MAKPISHTLAPLGIAAAAALAIANWVLQPERAWFWGLSLVVLVGMTAALTVVRRWSGGQTPRDAAGDSIRGAVVFAALMLIIPLGTRLAANLGLPPHADTGRRLTMILMGAFLAFTGNTIPKTLTPLSALRCDPARAQALQRLLGWTWVLTGLGFSLAWIVLPPAVANPVSDVVLVAGMIVTVSQVFLGHRARPREAGL